MICSSRRVLKNREIEVVPAKPYLSHPLQITNQKQKDSIHTIENAIGKYIYIHVYIYIYIYILIYKHLKCSTTTSKKMLKYNKNNYKSTKRL